MKKIIKILLTLFLLSSFAYANTSTKSSNKKDIIAINEVLKKYAKSVDLATTNPELAEEIWITNETSNFIHPRGTEYGWQNIKNNFYKITMGETFSERKLNIHNDINIIIYGNTAIVMFTWDFVAKVSDDGTILKSEGRESQVMVKKNSKWKIANVHYSGPPVTGQKQGF